MDTYIKELYKLINKCDKNGDVPVAAIIVKNNKIIGKGYNKKNKTSYVINHAEIIAITKAAKKLKNWRLNDCDIYITLFPCPMCASAIQQSRIRNVYYINDCTDNNVKQISLSILSNNNLNHVCNLKKIENKVIEDKINNFFKEKRKK